jgi:hypothetical protein
MQLKKILRPATPLIICASIAALIVLFANFTVVQVFYFIKRNPTLVFVSATPFLAYFSWQTQKHLTRAKYTMDFQVSFSDSDNMKKAAKVFKRRLSKMTSEELIELAETGKPAKAHTHVVEILNAWERVAVALKHDVYDEDMLYSIYGSFLLSTCRTLSPYIKQKQAKNPLVFINLQELVICWRSRRDDFEGKRERMDAKIELKNSIRLNKLNGN